MSDCSYLLSFKCFHCGAIKEVFASRPLQFGFEVVEGAKQSGMYGDFDLRRGRALVFCNEEHANAQKTKSGFYRLRPMKTAA